MSEFTELLIPIVREALVRYEVKGEFDSAARMAIALKDTAAQERLLRRILVQREVKLWEYGAAGLLAAARGDIELAEEIIYELKKDIGDRQADELIVNIAVKLPDKLIARGIMRLFEDKEDEGQVLNIAAAIGDRQTSERLMKKMAGEGRLLYHVRTDRLVEAASYNPVLGKQLAKALLTSKDIPEDRKVWYIQCAGAVSAALGDKLSAEGAFEYLKEYGEKYKSSHCQLQAAKIAATLENIADAEEIVLRAFGSPVEFELWDRGNLSDIGEIIWNIAKRNMEATKRIWKYGEEGELVKMVLPLVAVRVLEISGDKPTTL